VRKRHDLGKRLRHFRHSAELTQEDVAHRARLSAKFISEVENNRRSPTIGVLTRLVEDGLKVPLAAFFSSDRPGDIADDVKQLDALLAGQSAVMRRRALRLLSALFEE
jgi:transcriptional regulator with XRE-family HTH domain